MRRHRRAVVVSCAIVLLTTALAAAPSAAASQRQARQIVAHANFNPLHRLARRGTDSSAGGVAVERPSRVLNQRDVTTGERV
jgi:hypothetical protein